MFLIKVFVKFKEYVYNLLRKFKSSKNVNILIYY